MTQTIERPPRPDLTPGAEPAPPFREVELRRPTATWAWVRLGMLLLVAAATQLVYVGFWPLSYYLSQAADFTYQYVAQYPAVWERLLPLLLRFEATWPQGVGSVEFMVDALIWAFAAAFGLYLAAFFLVRAGLPSGWDAVAVLAPALAFQATLFLMPGLFTTDLFSYVVYGEIAGPYRLNPYVHLPAYFPQNPVFHWIHPIWHYAPSIYGPAWIDVSWLVGGGVATFSSVDKVLAYKLLVNIAHLGGVGCLAWAVHRLRPGQVLPSVLLYAWNPLILFEFGGNGHNDAVMVAVMLLAVALFAGGARFGSTTTALGLIALAVSAMIKMSSVLLLSYVVIAEARKRPTPIGVAQVFAVSGLTVLVVVVGLYLPWWVGIQTVAPILTWSQGPMYLNYAPDMLAQRLVSAYYSELAAYDPFTAMDRARGLVKSTLRLYFFGYCAWELFRVWGGKSPVGAGARVMLAFLLVSNTWVLPWYFTWPLALAIVHGWDSPTAKVLLGFSLTAPIVLYYRHFWFPYVTDVTFLIYLAPLLIAPMTLVLRRSSRSPVAVDGSPAPPTPRPYGVEGQSEPGQSGPNQTDPSAAPLRNA